MAYSEQLLKRLREGMPELAVKSFLHYYDQLVAGKTGLIDQSQIKPLADAPDLERLPDFSAEGSSALSQTVVIKLNGGLGTSMGLNKAKSLLPVRQGVSFLDIVVRQTLSMRERFGIRLPLILMNSFNTAEDTEHALVAYPELARGQVDVPVSLVQNKVPKIRADNLLPVSWPADPSHEWCPPGHGDIYIALVTSGLLQKLLEQGYQYAFVANIDNLGAIIDEQILGYLVNQKLGFLMEVADRTEADRKGGHVAIKNAGGLILRESVQCPESEKDDFQDIHKYKYFNTNNLWIDLRALEELLANRRYLLDLPLIKNLKNVDPQDSNSPKVYQLETAMGAALSAFERAGVLRVPRRRFAPVKTTEDLLALWSDCFVLSEDARLTPNPARKYGTISIQLDPRYYKIMRDFEAHFPDGAPSLIECESLKVTGNVIFGAGVKITGRAVVANDAAEPRYITSTVI